MAELADALALGASGLAVQVQVLSPAPFSPAYAGDFLGDNFGKTIVYFCFNAILLCNDWLYST